MFAAVGLFLFLSFFLSFSRRKKWGKEEFRDGNFEVLLATHLRRRFSFLARKKRWENVVAALLAKPTFFLGKWRCVSLARLEGKKAQSPFLLSPANAHVITKSRPYLGIIVPYMICQSIRRKTQQVNSQETKEGKTESVFSRWGFFHPPEAYLAGRYLAEKKERKTENGKMDGKTCAEKN